MLTITTSWDDGDVLDNRLAQLLDRYDIKGTFYITKQYRKNRLSEQEIRGLSLRHEIGAHTLTHPDLRKISRERKVEEIRGSKQWLESVVGKEIPMFCYTAGNFDEETIAVVKETGFKGARTTAFGEIGPIQDSYQMPTTIHTYPMPLRKTGAHGYLWSHLLQPLTQRMPTFRKLGVPLVAMRSWKTMACTVFDIAMQKGETYHLWGHSWEVELYDMWGELEEVLQYIGRQENCHYVTNGETLAIL